MKSTFLTVACFVITVGSNGKGFLSQAPVVAEAATKILVDDTPGLGRRFDGIGGLSGGGATSKLLVNYPEKQRDEILDYLFKPNFGASLQILKVEIGGDVQSTDGTEASHMHNSWEENYSRGYEWWLMVEAKKRNPDIKLYGLPWGFPGWIGQGTRSPWVNPNITADYIVRWIAGAKTHYNLTIDYIGIWNERNYDITYIKTLRKTLDMRGFMHVQIVAADEKWEIVNDLNKDPELASIVDAVGCHYPGTESTKDAMSVGKALWASEDYSTFNDEVGAGCWARILNQNYVNGLMTATISWNLIGSYYDGLPYYRDGLMTAVEPWSGSYVVQSPIWVSAHTTQFTSIGWKYLQHGNGVGKFQSGGSYVALVNPAVNQLTIVIEKLSHDHSKCIRPNLPAYNTSAEDVVIVLGGHFASVSQMYVWYSKLGFDGQQSNMFQRKEPLKFVNGQATLSVGVDEIYTLTTVNGGVRGSYPGVPTSKPFPLPYKDDFEDYSMFEEPDNLAQQTGSFEVLSSGQNKHIRQMVLQAPVSWCEAENVNKAINIIGDNSWTDNFVEIDYDFPDVNATDGVFVAARINAGGCQAFTAHGIYLFAFQDNKFMLTNDLARTKVLNQGNFPPGSGWRKLSLLVQGQSVTGAMDGKILFNVTVPDTPKNGFAGIGTDNFGLADFDNLYIATKEEGLRRMNKYAKRSEPQPLYFVKEHH